MNCKPIGRPFDLTFDKVIEYSGNPANFTVLLLINHWHTLLMVDHQFLHLNLNVVVGAVGPTTTS